MKILVLGCITHGNASLSTLGALYLSGLCVIKFDTTNFQPCFPYHVNFQLHVECLNKTIKHMVIDEGASTSMMSLSYWKGLSSPKLFQSMTMLTSWYYSFSKVYLDGKMVLVEVKVVDSPLDYNHLMGRNSIYTMKEVVSCVFCTL